MHYTTRDSNILYCMKSVLLYTAWDSNALYCTRSFFRYTAWDSNTLYCTRSVLLNTAWDSNALYCLRQQYTILHDISFAQYCTRQQYNILHWPISVYFTTIILHNFVYTQLCIGWLFIYFTRIRNVLYCTIVEKLNKVPFTGRNHYYSTLQWSYMHYAAIYQLITSTTLYTRSLINYTARDQ